MSTQPIRILAADPPWTYDDKLTMEKDRLRSPEDFYNVLSIADLLLFLHTNGPAGGVRNKNEDGWIHPNFSDCLAMDAILFLWATNPFILSGEAQEVCKAWGFKPKQMIPWVKGRLDVDVPKEYPEDRCYDAFLDSVKPKLVLQTGMGFYTRGVSEHLIVATRGEATWLVKDRGVNGLIVAPEEAFILAPRKAHSEKPQQAYDLIERLIEPGHRQVELFARKQRPGWECYGDQL